MSFAPRALNQPSVFHARTSVNPSIDLLHLKLFHHFTTHTIPTLILPSKVWNDVIRLSFNFEFLASIMLCVSARHLAYLHPTEHLTYNSIAARHLGTCLTSFRQALLSDLKTFDIDAFISTSLLLQYDVWTDADVCSRHSDGVEVYDPSADRMFTFCSSLKRMFLSFLPRWPGRLENSVFLQHLRQAPKLTLDDKTVNRSTGQVSFSDDESTASDQQRLSHRTEIGNEHRNDHERVDQISIDGEVQGHLREEGCSYQEVVDQVRIYESHLLVTDLTPSDRVKSQTAAFPDLVRSLFTFPVMCRGKFASLIQEKNSEALMVLCRFYRAIRMLLSPHQGWWAQRRTAAAEQGLMNSLQCLESY